LRKKYSITLEVRRKKKEKKLPPSPSKQGWKYSNFPQKLAHEMRSD